MLHSLYCVSLEFSSLDNCEGRSAARKDKSGVERRSDRRGKNGHVMAHVGEENDGRGRKGLYLLTSQPLRYHCVSAGEVVPGLRHSGGVPPDGAV